MGVLPITLADPGNPIAEPPLPPAVDRLRAPQPLERLGLGLALSTLASLVNLGVARILLRAGRRHHSIALEADGHHLMTDVWTSAGVLVGIGLLKRKPWARVLALVVAVFALFSFPIGTIIAIYSFWVLTREETQQLLRGAM